MEAHVAKIKSKYIFYIKRPKNLYKCLSYELLGNINFTYKWKGDKKFILVDLN